METKALIYKTQDYQESSRLLYTYTPYGKYTLVAKGAKRYKSAYRSYDYLTLIELDLNIEKPIQTLQKSSISNYYESIKANYQHISYTSTILKSLDLITDDLPHERLFKLITWLLTFEDLELACITLYIKLTYALGYELTFHKAFEGFDLYKGITTPISKTLNKEETTYLKELYFLKDEIHLNNDVKGVLKQFIKNYYIYHMDYDIKF